MSLQPTSSQQPGAPHVPVMLPQVLRWLAPQAGEIHVDGTFGAGGYTKGILAAADCKVLAIDQDPVALHLGQAVVAQSNGRLTLVEGQFADMENLCAEAGISAVDGVVLDVGVSSMQVDTAERGFSFLRDGPLDMRMSSSGASAADTIATLGQDELADIIFVLGEEPKARGIARAILKARSEAPITTTLQLVKAIERATGPQRAHMRTHPATRAFQALRIYVNQELEQLALALSAAERLLRPGGRLVVVTFHSLEDRIVKQFLAQRSGNTPGPSRHAPLATDQRAPSFTLPFKGHDAASEDELAQNPRSRSAKLRCGIRTAAAPWPEDLAAVSVPALRDRKH